MAQALAFRGTKAGLRMADPPVGANESLAPDSGKYDGERDGLFLLGLLSWWPSCPLQKVAA